MRLAPRGSLLCDGASPTRLLGPTAVATYASPILGELLAHRSAVSGALPYVARSCPTPLRFLVGRAIAPHA